MIINYNKIFTFTLLVFFNENLSISLMILSWYKLVKHLLKILKMILDEWVGILFSYMDLIDNDSKICFF